MGARLGNDGFRLEVGGDRPWPCIAAFRNAAGLDAQTVGRALGLRSAPVPARHLAKGNYFVLGPRPAFAI